jgi:ribosomal protein L32
MQDTNNVPVCKRQRRQQKSDTSLFLTEFWRRDKVTLVSFQQAEDRKLPHRLCEAC